MAEHTAAISLPLFLIVLVKFTYRYSVWRSGHVTEQFKLTDVLEKVNTEANEMERKGTVNVIHDWENSILMY